MNSFVKNSNASITPRSLTLATMLATKLDIFGQNSPRKLGDFTRKIVLVLTKNAVADLKKAGADMIA
jgi:hypothetical protein